MNRPARIILALAVAAVLVIGAISYGFHYVIVNTTRDVAKTIVDAVKSAFNFTPQVTVNGVTVIEQSSPVLELATIQRDVMCQHDWSQTWFGSTKTMELQGTYRVKAGFDLRKSFRISVEGGRITATLPAPKILSIEMTGYKALQDEDGWWNKINSDDREKAIAAMQDEARSKAEQSGILDEAKAKFTQQFDTMIKGLNLNTPVETKFQDEVPAPVAPQGG